MYVAIYLFVVSGHQLLARQNENYLNLAEESANQVQKHHHQNVVFQSIFHY